MRASILPFLAVVLLAACTTTPPADSVPEAAAVAPAQTEPQAPQPAAASSAPVGPAAKAHAQKLALNAAELLEEGSLDEAKAELQQALAADPGNRIAASLLKQMSADPVAVLGTESFNYTVRQGDSLSKIAGRFLGDIYQFHILARYNDIRVPKQVHVGQLIRVPGKAPPPSAITEQPPKPAAAPKRPAEDKAAEGKKPRPFDALAPEKPAAPPPVAAPPAAEVQPEPVSPGERAYQSGLQAMKAGDKERAYAAFVQATKLDPKHGDAKVKAGQLRQELVRVHHRNATAAFHRQDMDTAIREWDKVLELDPGNESAKLNRQRAVDLAARIKQMR